MYKFELFADYLNNKTPWYKSRYKYYLHQNNISYNSIVYLQIIIMDGFQKNCVSYNLIELVEIDFLF